VAWVALVAAGCGRIGFDANRDGGATADAAPPTGLRWVKFYPAANPTSFARVTAAAPDGAGGAVAVVPFEGTMQLDGLDIVTTGFGLDTLATAVQASGSTTWSHQLHAGFNCDMRAVHVVPGDRAIVGGLTSGPLLGDGDPCDLGANSPQDPIAIDYLPDGTFVGRTVWDATAQNAQLWQIRSYPDGSRALFGIYRGNLTIDGLVLPGATAESPFVARTGGSATWAHGWPSATDVYPHSMDLGADGDVCITGWLTTNVTILGTPLATAGGDDVWIARLAPDGAPRFVRSIGGTGGEHPFGVIAMPGGGCMVAVGFGADLPLGANAGTLVHQGATDTAIVRLDPAGEVIRAATIASAGTEQPGGLVLTGEAVFAVVQVNAPLTIGSTLVDPQGGDAVVVQATYDLDLSVAAILTGAGSVSSYGAAARDGDVVVYGTYTGELVIGPYADTRAAESGFVMGADLR
jgi:hypothetical protein